MYEVGPGLLVAFPDGRHDCYDLSGDPAAPGQAGAPHAVLADGHGALSIVVVSGTRVRATERPSNALVVKFPLAALEAPRGLAAQEFGAFRRVCISRVRAQAQFQGSPVFSLGLVVERELAQHGALAALVYEVGLGLVPVRLRRRRRPKTRRFRCWGSSAVLLVRRRHFPAALQIRPLRALFDVLDFGPGSRNGV